MKINTDYTDEAKSSLKGLKKELEKNILNLKNIELPIFCIVINQLDSTINTIEELEKFVNIFNNNTLEEILKNKETTNTPIENDSEYHFNNDNLKKSYYKVYKGSLTTYGISSENPGVLKPLRPHDLGEVFEKNPSV